MWIIDRLRFQNHQVFLKLRLHQNQRKFRRLKGKIKKKPRAVVFQQSFLTLIEEDKCQFLQMCDLYSPVSSQP